jgi:hypothetical protein
MTMVSSLSRNLPDAFTKCQAKKKNPARRVVVVSGRISRTQNSDKQTTQDGQRENISLVKIETIG